MFSKSNKSETERTFNSLRRSRTGSMVSFLGSGLAFGLAVANPEYVGILVLAGLAGAGIGGFSLERLWDQSHYDVTVRESGGKRPTGPEARIHSRPEPAA
jgi:hypothetical protein